MSSSRTLTAALAAGGVILAAGGVLFAAAPASAASVDAQQPIKSVTTYIAGGQPGQTTVNLGDQLTTAIKWCAPLGAKPGDTFTLSLDPKLTNLPSGFDLDDPSTGAPVASGSIAGNAPGVITFTLLTYITTHNDTCGTASVTSDFNPGSVRLGQPNPFTDTAGDGRQFSTNITPNGTAQGNLDYPAKYAAWLRPDQGRTDPTDFLGWFVTTPQGPFDSATTTDSLPAGQDWTWDCATLKLEDGTVNSAGDFVSTAVITPAPGSTTVPNFTCSPTAITVNWGAQVRGSIFRVSAETSIPAATGQGAAQTFTNTANVTTTTAGVATTYQPVTSSMRQASAVGEGAGVAVTAATPTPSPSTPAATPSAPATVAPAVVTKPTTSSRALAYTGSQPGPALYVGGALLLLGGVVTALATIRSRRRTR